MNSEKTLYVYEFIYFKHLFRILHLEFRQLESYVNNIYYIYTINIDDIIALLFINFPYLHIIKISLHNIHSLLIICFSFTSLLDMDRNAPEWRSGRVKLEF